jgi:hypothetical protein
MAFTAEQRQHLIGEITANSDFNEDILENLTDNQLVALAEPDRLDELVNNAAMPPQLAKAQKEKAEPVMEEDDEEDDEEEEVVVAKKYPKKMSTNQWMAQAPPELRRLVANAQRIEAEQRSQLIETITANEACPFTADDLKGRSLEDLKAFAAMATVNSSGSLSSENYDFVGFGGAPVVNRSVPDAKPLTLPTAEYMNPKN